MKRLLALGGDPGRHGGLGLVEMRPGRRPLAVGAWAIHGHDQTAWWRSCREAHAEAAHLIVEAVEWVPYWLEEPPPAFQQKGDKALDGDERGLRSWTGLGRFQGMMIAGALEASMGEPALHLPSAWWAQWPGIFRGKQGDGTHRIREAGVFIEGAGPMLAAVPLTCRVDVAEAMLIAGACGLVELAASILTGSRSDRGPRPAPGTAGTAAGMPPARSRTSRAGPS